MDEDIFDVSASAHSMLNPNGGGRFELSAPPSPNTRSNVIDADTPYPKRTGLRFNLRPWHLGKLEKLARSRFDISELTEGDIENWDKTSDAERWTIAQSVLASSEIEGESVYVKSLEIIETPATEPLVGKIENELEKRMQAIRSIYETYLWAFSQRPEPVLTYEMILEFHRRMFQTTKGDRAGRIKEEPVIISGGGYEIKTLPPEKVQKFLTERVQSFSRQWGLSERYGEYCRLVLITELILDFLAIHPFDDGNGRTARLLSTYLLERAGYHFARFYPIDTVILETRPEYYEALFNSQKSWLGKDEDISPWTDYFIGVVYTQYSRAYERVRDAAVKRSR